MLRVSVEESSVCACWRWRAAHSSAYAVRPVPRIAADNVGKPVSRLQEAFGQPRKIDRRRRSRSTCGSCAKAGRRAAGFHGCEMEVTVDARSQHVLGYSLSNIGWSKCREVERQIRVAER